MKIVWVTRADPSPPHSGDLLYTRGLLEGLAEAGATVTLLAYRRTTPSESLPSGIDSHLFTAPRRSRLWSLGSALPSDAFRLRSTAMESAIGREIEKRPDAIVIDYFAMGWCVAAVQARLRQMAPHRRPMLIYVSHNHEQTVRKSVARSSSGSAPTRLVLSWDAVKSVALERRLLRAADLVTTTTDADARLFGKDDPALPLVTLLPGYSGAIDRTAPPIAERPREVLLLGSLEWIAKKDNTRRFLAAAAEPFTKAGIRVIVAGKTDPAFADELKAYASFCTMRGYVDDAAPLLRRARLGLMHDEVGGGFKLRVLTYVFHGLPVAAIATQTAGLPDDLGAAVLQADTVQDLVQALVRHIDDDARLEAMRTAALQAAEGRFSWVDRGRLLLAAIEGVRSSRGTAPVNPP